MFVHKIAMGIGYGLNMFTMLKTVSSSPPPLLPSPTLGYSLDQSIVDVCGLC